MCVCVWAFNIYLAEWDPGCWASSVGREAIEKQNINVIGLTRVSNDFIEILYPSEFRSHLRHPNTARSRSAWITWSHKRLNEKIADKIKYLLR